MLREVEADSTLSLSRICIVGYASPDGNHEFNQRLARKRANSLASYLLARFCLPETLMVVEGTGINWRGLDRAVEASSLENKVRVLDIIRNEPENTYDSRGVLVRSRKQQLRMLDGGRTWAWMMQRLYPSLRGATSVVCYVARRPAKVPEVPCDEPIGIEATEVEVTDVVETTVEVDSLLPEVPVVPAVKAVRYPVMALRSNLLLPLLNVGVEVPIGNRWSVGADYYYPWQQRKADHKNCFQLIFVSGEARYWFGQGHSADRANRPNRLRGHSVGAYGAWGYYDFEHDFSGHQGDFWSAGVDYVYAVPVFGGRMHMEFQIAAGLIQSQAQPYNVFVEGGKAIREHGVKKNVSYFGPTKVGVSLVLPVKVKMK